MKKFPLFVLLLTAVNTAMTQVSMNVMSFNIRYNNPRDSANAWPNRKDLVASQILFHEVQLLGVQEALQGQMMDLQERLPGYQFFGVGREDGKEKGEYPAIFYDARKFQVVHSNTFWLSAQPEVPGSKGWDADITRVVTWARFREKKLFIKNKVKVFKYATLSQTRHGRFSSDHFPMLAKVEL